MEAVPESGAACNVPHGGGRSGVTRVVGCILNSAIRKRLCHTFVVCQASSHTTNARRSHFAVTGINWSAHTLSITTIKTRQSNKQFTDTQSSNV